MALSMDGVSNYLNTDATFNKNTEKASKVSSSISNVNANSTDEELTEAVESFESYMLEQVIKQVKDSIKMDEDDEDSSTKQMTEFYMDSTIQSLASTMVKEYGGNLTKDLVNQMKRNYGMSTEEALMNKNDAAEDVTDTQEITPEQAAAAGSAVQDDKE